MPDEGEDIVNTPSLPISPNDKDEMDEFYGMSNAPKEPASKFDWFSVIRSWGKVASEIYEDIPSIPGTDTIRSGALDAFSLGIDTSGRAGRTAISKVLSIDKDILQGNFGNIPGRVKDLPGQVLDAALSEDHSVSANQLKHQVGIPDIEGKDLPDWLVANTANSLDVFNRPMGLPHGGGKELIAKGINMGADFITGVASDPATLITGVASVTAKGAKAASAGRQALKIASDMGVEGRIVHGTGKMFEARQYLAKAGVAAEDVFGSFSGKVPGIKNSLAEDLKAGNKSILQLGLPEIIFGPNTNITIPGLDKTLTPIIEAVAKGLTTGTELAEATAMGQKVLKSWRWTKNIFSNPPSAHAGGVLQNYANAMGNDAARLLIRDVENAGAVLQKSGLSPAQYKKPLMAMMETADKEGAELKPIFEAARREIETWAPKHRDAVLQAMDELTAAGKAAHKAMNAHGVEVDSLSGAVQRDMAIAADVVQKARAKNVIDFGLREIGYQDNIIAAEKELNKNIMSRMREKLKGTTATDASGNPKMMYSGTPASDKFRHLKTSDEGLLFLTDDPGQASAYAAGTIHGQGFEKLADKAPGIFPVFVKTKKIFNTKYSEDMAVYDEIVGKLGKAWLEKEGYVPQGIESSGLPLFDIIHKPEFVKELKLRGYDGALLDEGSTLGKKSWESLAIFDSKQVHYPFDPMSSLSGEELDSLGVYVNKAKLKLNELQTKGITDTPEILKLEKQYQHYKYINDNSPNWVAAIATPEALSQFVKKGGSLAALERPEIKVAMARTVEKNGVKLGIVQFDKIVQEGGTAVTAYKPIKGGLGIRDAFNAFRNGGSDEVTKASEAIGEFFHMDPVVAMHSRFNAMPSAISKAENLQGAVNIWGRDIDTVRKGKNGLAGWVDMGRISDKHAGTYVPQAVHDGLVSQWNIAKHNLPEWSQFMQTYTKHWKALTTAPVPVFHMRNAIGNMIRRMQEGAIDLSQTGLSNEYNIRKLITMDASGATNAELAAINVDLGEHGIVSGDKFLTMSRETGVIGTGIWSVDIGNEYALQKGWLNTFMRGTIPGSKKVMKAAGKVMGFKSGGEGVSFEKAGNIIESMDRAGAFAVFLRKGESQQGARHLVGKTLFDYQNVSPAVHAARTMGIYPFAGWSAKNIPAQVEVFLTRPGQFTAMLHAKNAIENQVPNLNRNNMVRYVKDKFNIVVDYRDGEYGVVDTSGWLPLSDLPDVTGEDGIRNLLTKSLGPIPRATLHAITKINSFTSKSVKDLDDQYGVLSTPVGNIPLPADVGFEIQNLMPRFPGAALRWNGPEKTVKSWDTNNFLSPIPVRTYNEKDGMQADINYYKSQVSKARADVKKWASQDNKIMEEISTKVMMDKIDQYRKYLNRNAPKQSVP